MSIITISRGSYSKGKAVAEKLASNLGYECIARDVIVEAAKEFNITETKLIRALHDSPSILDRFTYGKEKYMAYIRHAFLHQVKKDNVVYHGLAGHLFLMHAPNVLKVRIIANMEDRIREEVRRESISENEAKKILIKDDQERRKWSQYLYGVDTWDASLYDLIIHIDKLNVDDAADLISSASKSPCFRSTTETQAYIEDLYIAGKVQAILIDRYPTVDTSSQQGVVHVCYKDALGNDQKKENDITKLLQGVEGVRKIEFDTVPILVPD